MVGKELSVSEFIMESKRNSSCKIAFTERIKDEIEAISMINDQRTYMDRLKFKHQLELIMLALKCGNLMNQEENNNEIMDLLQRLDG